MQRFLRAVDSMGPAGRQRQLEFVILHINTDGASSAGIRTGHDAEPYSAATKNRHRIGPGDPPARHRVKAHRERLNQAQLLPRKPGRIQLFAGHRDEFGERTVPLHAESLVELAGIRTPPPA